MQIEFSAGHCRHRSAFVIILSSDILFIVSREYPERCCMILLHMDFEGYLEERTQRARIVILKAEFLLLLKF